MKPAPRADHPNNIQHWLAEERAALLGQAHAIAEVYRVEVAAAKARGTPYRYLVIVRADRRNGAPRIEWCTVTTAGARLRVARYQNVPNRSTKPTFPISAFPAAAAEERAAIAAAEARFGRIRAKALARIAEAVGTYRSLGQPDAEEQ